MSVAGLPNPWLILGVFIALAGAWTHGNYTGRVDVKEAWRLDVAESDRKALTEKARIDADNAGKDLAQAEATRNMETEYAKRLQAADAGRDAFERRINDRLRRSQQELAHCKLSLETSGAGGDEAGRPGDLGLGIVSRGAVSRVRDVGKQLQAELMLCKAWVRENGR